LQKRVFFDIIFWFWNFMLGNASVSDDIDTLSDHRCVHPMFANVRVKTNQKYFGTWMVGSHVREQNATFYHHKKMVGTSPQNNFRSWEGWAKDGKVGVGHELVGEGGKREG
jgi:hypothetical protein